MNPTMTLTKPDSGTLDAITLEEIVKSVERVDLAQVAEALTTQQPFGKPSTFTQNEIGGVVARYRMFWVLNRAYPDAVFTPPLDVDEVWHEHSGHTTQYGIDSMRVFGRFLHHVPGFGTRDPAEAARHAAAFELTCALYVKHFSVDPVESALAWVTSKHHRDYVYFTEVGSDITESIQLMAGTCRSSMAAADCNAA